MTKNTTYNIPMDKESYEILKEGLMHMLAARFRYKIDYDEDFQQAHIWCRDGEWIEQTQNEYIITDRRGTDIYFINKQNGKLDEIYCHRLSKCSGLVDGITRVYGDYNKDFIYDQLKVYIRALADNEDGYFEFYLGDHDKLLRTLSPIY